MLPQPWSAMIVLRDFFALINNYSVSVSNRIKKFDVKGAKRYFMKNVDKFLPVILANKQNFY